MNNNNEEPKGKQYNSYDEFIEAYPEYPEPETIDCLDLPMKRDNALAIINGEKKVDFRAYTQHYVDKLYDKETENFVERHKNEPNVLKWCDTMRLVDKILFHDYNRTWTLLVSCEYQDLCAPIKEDIQILHDEYNCHEMDALYRKLEREKSNKRPLFFYFEIGEILERNNI